MSAEATQPGVLPDPLPVVEFEPGETGPVEGRHYRNRDTRAPLCGAEPSDATPYARKWDDVTCEACLAAKPERGRKAKKAAPKKESAPKKADPQVEQVDMVPALPALVAKGVNMALYLNHRAPALDEPLMAFSVNVVAALDHYGLLEHAAHPLAGVFVSGAILVYTIKDAPRIDDLEELNALHGMPNVSE